MEKFTKWNTFIGYSSVWFYYKTIIDQYKPKYNIQKRNLHHALDTAPKKYMIV